MGQDLEQLDHALALVDDYDGPGAQHGAGRGERFVIQLYRPGFLGGEDRRGGAAGDDGLQPLARLEPAAAFLEQVAEGHAEGQLVDSGLVHRAADAEKLGAGAFAVADGGVPVPAVAYYRGHGGEGLHVVYHGGAAEQALYRREGRLQARLALEPFQGFQQGGLLAADIGPGAAVGEDLEIETGAEDVPADKAFRPRGGYGLVQELGLGGELAADVDIGVAGPDGVGGYGHPLYQGVRVLQYQLPVLESSGLTLVRVADQVARPLGVLGDEGPFEPAREASAAAAAQVGLLDLVDNFRRLEAERLLERLIAAGREIGLYFHDIIFEEYVFHRLVRQPAVPQLFQQGVELSFVQLLEIFLVDLHHGGRAAGAQAFHGGEGEQPVLRRFPFLDRELGAEPPEQALGPGHMAGDIAADLQVVFSHGLQVEHRIKSSYGFDARIGQTEEQGQGVHPFLRHVAGLFLHFLQERDEGGVPARVFRADLFGPGLEFFSEFERHYLSSSPPIMFIWPKVETMSAI